MANIEQLERLIKRLFIADYLHYGLFPCQSDVVRLIRADKMDWNDNDDIFEYKVKSQTYRATYGTVTDGFDVNMMVNLETKEKEAAFESDYASQMRITRNNMADAFKNFAIHGRFGVVHQLRKTIDAPNIEAQQNPQANTGFTPTIGVPFTIKTPINVFSSNFKKGKLLIKTTEAAPWGAADVAEMYMVLNNQPNLLTLLPCGTATSPWQDGEFLEVAQNREIDGVPSDTFNKWNTRAITVSDGPYQGKYDHFEGTGSYTSGANAITGAMEGLADLFPWYTNPANMETRFGLDMPFRGQANRLRYTVEMAGSYVVQKQDEHIIRAIMRGFDRMNADEAYADIGIWINPVILDRMAQEEDRNVQVIRDNLVEKLVVYQHDVKNTDYQIGNQVVEDYNMPTDVIIIGPKNDMRYNCWDNATFEIDECIQEMWSNSELPKIEDLQIPDELIAKLDLSQRIICGSPTLRDGRTVDNIRHPAKVMPVAIYEMGALFTEHPYAYTVVKLREPICDLPTT